MATAGVDFFRIDRSGPTKRRLLLASSLVGIGGTSVGAHLVHRINHVVGSVLSLAGGAAVLSGLLLGFGTIALLLFEDIYLRIRVDDLLVHENGKETSIAWDSIAGVDAEAAKGNLVIRLHEGEPIRFQAGGDSADIAARVEDARRKAAHGLLRGRLLR